MSVAFDLTKVRGTIMGEKSKLIKEYDKAVEIASKLRRKLDVLKLAEEFEGKYFRFENNSGSGRKWFVYSFCEKVIGPNKAIIHSFEIEPEGRCSFKVGMGFQFLFQTQITKEQWDSALRKFKQHTERLGKAKKRDRVRAI